MVGYKLNTKDIKLLKKLMDKFGEIAKLLKNSARREVLFIQNQVGRKLQKFYINQGTSLTKKH